MSIKMKICKWKKEIIILLVVGFCILYVITGATLSVMKNTRQEFSKEEGAGYFAYYSNGSYEIGINLEDNSSIVRRHEYCHYRQFKEGRIYESVLGNFINEVECYIKEWLPTKIPKEINFTYY